MTIKERINNDIKDAMRAKESKKLGALRLITAAIKQIEVDTRELLVDDAGILHILEKLLKQRKESITQFQLAQREDLIAQEQFEIDIISAYMPEPLSDDEINALIQKTMEALQAEKISDMGKVIAELKPKLLGRADMAKVSALVKAKLS
jgi:uncharacterized protein YqeY